MMRSYEIGTYYAHCATCPCTSHKPLGRRPHEVVPKLSVNASHFPSLSTTVWVLMPSPVARAREIPGRASGARPGGIVEEELCCT